MIYGYENYDNSIAVTITVTCYSWAPSSGDHLCTCGAIVWLPHNPAIQLSVLWLVVMWRENTWW